ncbi:major facilitator superfamily domain-containing protein [Lipomyces oligophaga]|uniref:major facilitator superfamily domain-containing protein n=1 Tax=Lipomyces oligophaga TaxID=45792 RepID=UPI0034D00012
MSLLHEKEELRGDRENTDYGSLLSESSSSDKATTLVSEETEAKQEQQDAEFLLEDEQKGIFDDYGELAELLELGTDGWTEEEDRRVRLKADIRIMLWACVTFFSLQLNRINIVNVLTTDFLFDLNMRQNDFSLGQTVYFFSFMAMEIPTQIMNQIMGPTIWIPTMMSLWALVGLCQAFVTDRASYLAVRALLGACSGGFVPGIALYVTGFYKAHEMATRLAMLWTMQYITNAISALLGSAIFNMNGINGWHDWQWLFLLEGILTLSIGLATFVMMPNFRKPNLSRFFTPREQAILRARVILDDPSKARQLDNRRTSTFANLGFKDIYKTVTDIYLLPMFTLAFVGFLPSVASYQFMTIMFRSYGYSTNESNLLVIPANMTIMTGMLFVSNYADKYKKRWPVPLMAMAWVLTFLIIMRSLPDSAPAGVRAFCVIFTVGFPYYTPVLISWLSANTNDQHKRALAVAIYNIGVQLGSLSAANVYRENDAPFYKNGNIALIVVAVFNVCLTLFTKVWYTRENKRREAIWSGMTLEQREHYSATTNDVANKRLDFRLQL